MFLCDGKVGHTYSVQNINLPSEIEKRLEALGMTDGANISILNRKGKGILIVKLRGTRFALGFN